MNDFQGWESPYWFSRQMKERMKMNKEITNEEIKNILKKMTGVSFTDKMIEDLRKKITK